MQTTTFQENGASDGMIDIFSERNLFILDMEDPDSFLAGAGRVDIPIALDDSECAFAYEEYLDPADGDLSARRNCDIYDESDPRVLQFVQVEADAQAAYAGLPEEMAEQCLAFEIPDEKIQNVSIDTASERIGQYIAEQGVDGICVSRSEAAQQLYAREYMGFTLDGQSISKQQAVDLMRLYVNYRKYSDDGGEKIQLYFNYMNYLNSPYLRIGDDGLVYVDTIDGTYLSLKQDEDGTLDIVT